MIMIMIIIIMAYDMVPHSWIEEVMGMMGIADNIKKFMLDSMQRWKTRLEYEGKQLGEVRIKRGIFQGDSLSPLMFVMAMILMTCVLRKTKPAYTLKNKSKLNHLLYMDDLKLYAKSQNEIESLIHTVRIFSDDIGMEFRLDKCATIKMKRGKLVEMERVTLAEGTKCQLWKRMENTNTLVFQKRMTSSIRK